MKRTIKAFLIVILTVKSISYSFGQQLNKEQIQVIANDLLISSKYHVNIKKILPVINGIQVVLLEIPYREFPSIIIINKDKSANKWVRIFECLSPGIQDKPSGLLDWHTKGLGVDFEIGKAKTYGFNDKQVRAVVESSFAVKSGAIIPYQNFIHMNTAANSGHPGFVPYTIDKTQYFDFANALFNDRYKNYPAGTCEMFDTPAITDCNFDRINNLYVIKATTATNQIWTYTFEGVDEKNRYLTDKKIIVEKKQ